MTTNQFTTELQKAEFNAISDLNGQWCVVIRYGTFKAFPLAFAVGRDYHIVAVTIY